jgi:hypothetical protein
VQQNYRQTVDGTAYFVGNRQDRSANYLIWTFRFESFLPQRRVAKENVSWAAHSRLR